MWDIENIISKGDYNYALVKNHPNSTKNGYVLEHRVIMENHIGRMLKKGEVVHHKNGDRKDNRIQNLSLMTRKEHNKLHQTKYQNGHFVEYKCAECGKEFKREYNQRKELKNTKNIFCSRRCNGKFQRREQLK